MLVPLMFIITENTVLAILFT